MSILWLRRRIAREKQVPGDNATLLRLIARSRTAAGYAVEDAATIIYQEKSHTPQIPIKTEPPILSWDEFTMCNMYV